MESVIQNVDQRTQLVGKNRLELLLFSLGGRQRFGINVFKVREVILCPPLNFVPNAHPVVAGVVTIRGTTISVYDLAKALGMEPISDPESCYIIVAENNRHVNGFLVRGVDRIVNMKWEDIRPPPRGMGPGSYLTAVTEVGDELVEILDVERVLVDIVGDNEGLSEEVKNNLKVETSAVRKALVVDDSSVARNQIKRTLDLIDIESTLVNNGQQAIELLQSLIADGSDIRDHYSLIIADVEMPKMDGYTLTRMVKEDPQLSHLYVILHTSLSGVFNEALVKKVGADAFVPKFQPDELATSVMEWFSSQGVSPE